MSKKMYCKLALDGMIEDWFCIECCYTCRKCDWGERYNCYNDTVYKTCIKDGKCIPEKKLVVEIL